MPIRPENAGRYPPDWKEIAARIRKRAGDRCECQGECGRGHTTRCQRRQGDPLPGGWHVVLTTAHLDHTPEHSGDANLRAMCQGCHLHYDRSHHAETAARTREQQSGQIRLSL